MKNKDEIILSIIIPELNGCKTIDKCLNSIYNQNVDLNLFEIISVDDKSTDNISIDYIEENYVQKEKFKNFRFLKNSENLHIGGARNKGIENASGTWILFLDCDDYLNCNVLMNLIVFIQHHDELDMVVYDFTTPYKPHNNIGLSTHMMSGPNFVQTQNIPWNAWCYVYNKDFIKRNKLRFVEKVSFEDVDFVFKCIWHSDKIQFFDLSILFYEQYLEQTSKIYANFKKAEDIFRLTLRLKNFANEIKGKDEESSNVIFKHHYFMYLHNLYFIWRFNYSQMLYLLKTYPAEGNNKNISPLILTSIKCPHFLCFLMLLFKPFLIIIARAKRKIDVSRQ